MIEAEGICKCYDQDSEKFHEAGYDAFLAGVVFIGMAKKLGKFFNTKFLNVNGFFD